MITRELLKTEIDFIQDEYLDVLYRFMKSLEMSLKELLRVERQSMKRVQKLEGIWEGLGFERISDVETSIREIRQDSEESLVRRIAKCST